MQTTTSKSFNQLTQPQRYRIIEEHGTYLGVFVLRGVFKIALFELFDFYVELYYNQATDRLHKAVAFHDYGRLDAYLDLVDISGVLVTSGAEGC